MDRFDRQQRIEGWDQGLIGDAVVSIVGSDMLAHYVLAGLAGLGFKNIRIIDNKRFFGKVRDKGFWFFDTPKGSSQSRSLEDICRRINPSSGPFGLHWKMLYNSSLHVFDRSDVVIDTTNDPLSKRMVWQYCIKHGKHFLHGSASQYQARFVAPDDNRRKEFLDQELCEDFKGCVQGIATSGFLGGLIAEEVRRKVMPLPSDSVIDSPIGYDICCSDRFIIRDVEKGRFSHDLSDKRVLMIGAGSLGNFVGLGLSLYGVGQITIVDDDIVEEVNLNRQVLFYDKVGVHKAIALCERLAEINPKSNHTPIVTRLTDDFDDFMSYNHYDCLIDCVDNFKTRVLLNMFAQKYDVPLVSGGTDPQGGRANIFVKGYSSCLDCQVNVSAQAEEELRREAVSCVHTPDPSVITSNQVTSNLMLGEVLHVLVPSLGDPMMGMLSYQSDHKNRVGSTIFKSCSCGDAYG